MIYVFAIVTFLLLYSFFGYPLTLFFISAISGKKQRTYPSDYFPTVTLVFPCCWEGKRIQAKIDNCLKLDYPKKKLEIIASPDGATTETLDILNKARKKGLLKVLENHPRSGKMMALARALKLCKSQVFVSTDADTILEPQHLKQLVAPFSNKKIGLTTGRIIYGNTGSSGISQGEGLYWKLEILTRRLESRIGRLVSATGPVYAIRPELFNPCDSKFPDDMLAALQVLEAGKEAIILEDVIAVDYIPESAKALFDKRVRQITSGIDLLIYRSQYVNPIRHPFLSFQNISHKVLRWMLPFLLLLIYISNVFMATNSLFWLIVLGCQSLFFLLGLLGGGLSRKGIKIPLVSSIWHLIISAWASLVAFFNVIRRKHYATWSETAQQ